MNKQLLLIILFIQVTFSIQAQVNILSIEPIDKGVYFLKYDSSALQKSGSKSIIVEFKDFLVLLEMPMAYSNSNISDHQAEGKKVLEAIQKKFNKKPLKYIVSSHWHPHSISSIAPFLEKNVQLITTSENFKILKPIIDSVVYEKHKNQVKFIDKDSFVIQDKSNSIVIYHLKKSQYSYLPSTDFLFTYLPNYKILQTSCMYQRFKKSKMRGKEMISGRTENLYEFVTQKNLKIDKYVCTDLFFDEADGMISNDTLTNLMRTGIGMLEIERALLLLPLKTLQEKSDSLIRTFTNDPIPYSIINKAVYHCIEHNDFQKALAYANLLVLLHPSSPYFWDTLGEVYYNLGEEKLALKYEKICQKLDPDFKDGGIATWKKNQLERLQKQ